MQQLSWKVEDLPFSSCTDAEDRERAETEIDRSLYRTSLGLLLCQACISGKPIGIHAQWAGRKGRKGEIC